MEKRGKSFRTNLKRRQHRIAYAVRQGVITLLSILLISAILGGVFFFFNYRSEHFKKGTIINSVDCSGLTVEEAYNQINEHLSNQTISYVFSDATVSASSSSYDLKLKSNVELVDILKKQNEGDDNKNFTVSNVYIDSAKLREYLLSSSHLNKSYMHKPQNAYLALGDDNLCYIVPEVLGNEIDFEEAYQLAISTLKSGETTIDFSTITKIYPSILSDDEELLERRDNLNMILSTVVQYSFPNGSTFTLDSNTIKDWLYLDENGLYQINVAESLETFMNTLEVVLNENNTYVLFHATDIGIVHIDLPESERVTLNREAEIAKIKEDFGTLQNRSPIYEKSTPTLDGKTSYVEIDITRQNVWMYKEGVCIVDTPCVTGNSWNHNTPSGVFNLTYKTTDTYLKGYNDDGSQYRSHVNYWMPFNGGIGLHDALWRSSFGGTIYQGNGSHGCVNLPLSAAETIYNNIDESMPIIVYAS